MSIRFRLLEQIFDVAMALPEGQRPAYVAERCAGDPQLLLDVESLLLHADRQTGAMQHHVGPVAASLLQPSNSHPRLTPGTMLGPYRLQRVLGEGGMGVVYLAADTRLDRQVAIKTIGGASMSSPVAAAELLREARSAAALAHPNIAGLYDCGSTNDTPWFVMEYVTGVTLRTILHPEGLSEAEIVRHAIQIAAALEYAHARQVVHRDIKPDNILIADDGAIKIIDFGLAGAAQGMAKMAGSREPLVGTLAYMAPELLLGNTATAAADIYSVGVVLYEMATGGHPWARVAGEEWVSAILAGGREDPTRQLTGTHPRIAAVVRRCMALDPAQRYRDGAELAAALAGMTTAVPVATVRGRLRVVVLDFVNITAGDGWLGTAIAETVAADLSRLDSVSVATRRRVLEVTHRVGDPASDATVAVEVGRKLAAQWIVSGTYQQSGNRIRVTPTLIDASTGSARPAGKVDGHVDAVFDLQDRVVATLLEALGIESVSRGGHTTLPDTRSLLAYEHYARGRQRLYQMDAASLGAAIQHFKLAVEIDPGYALAYAGLGTGYSLHFLRTSNPDDVARASDYLERATQIDATLGEPYPWLVNTRFRQNNPVGALEAAAKGVALQPDLPEAHYFCGGLHYMMAEHPQCDARMAPGPLAESIRLQPRFHPAWLVLGATAMFLGQHAAAVTILSEAITLEQEPDLAYRFVGAHALRGIALARSGNWTAAGPALLDALEVLGRCEHVYRDTFRALSSCVLGDVALRTGTPDQALAHYRHARRVIKDAARIAGSARLTIRADAGLAAAYAAAGDRARGRQLADQATGQLASVAAHTGTVTFECGLGQLCLSLAVAEVRLGRIDEAARLMGRARAFGWRDRVWLELDPELQPLQNHPVAARVLAELRAETLHQVPVPFRPQQDDESGTL